MPFSPSSAASCANESTKKLQYLKKPRKEKLTARDSINKARR